MQQSLILIALSLDPGYLFALLGRANAYLARIDRDNAGAELNAAVKLRVFRFYENQAQASS